MVAHSIPHRQAPPPAMTWSDSIANARTLDRWLANSSAIPTS
jgi:hypothetical protein